MASHTGKIDMIRGSIIKSAALFALPICVGNILQQLYGTVDTLVVGNFCDSAALAAVGTATQPMEILLCVFLGIGNGASILVSQEMGRRNADGLRMLVRTSVWFLYLCDIPVTILAMFVGPALLRLMQVPADAFDYAVLYLRITALGTLGNLGYNMNAGILRGLVNGLDGKMLYLKTLRDGEWTKLDSAEVVHGSFSMKGKIDSVQMTTLYMDDESVMPVVLESGKIVITISNTDLKAVGTPLNTALYDFIAKKNAMEESIGELERKETRMVMDGADLEEVHEQLLAEGDSLMKAMNQYVKTFISDNYENVLGPNVFIMLCSSLPYPIMTPQIDDIIKDAPYSFKSNKMVREFLTKAKENMQLIEEHQRMQQNVGPKK